MSDLYSTRRLFVLGGGAQQVAAFDTARSIGLSTICADPDPNARCRSLADHFYVADLADVATLEDIAATHAIDGALTLAADYPLDAVATLCDKFDLRGPSTDAVATVRDKARLRAATADVLVGSPRWQKCTSTNDAERCELLTAMACIVKPIDSSGGRGVTKLTPESSIDDKRHAIQAAFASSKHGRIIVEEFIEGSEYSVESFTFDGLTRSIAIAAKANSGSPYFLETGHVVPAELSPENVEQAREFVKRLVALVGIDNCATHVEIKLTPSGPVLIELAARLGGGFINTDLVPIATGIDMVKAAIDTALGITPDLQSSISEAAAVRFLIPPQGTYLGVSGIESAESMPHIDRVVCEYRTGDRIDVIRDATGRKAYLICRGRTPQEAGRLADRAADEIEFEVQN